MPWAMAGAGTCETLGGTLLEGLSCERTIPGIRGLASCLDGGPGMGMTL